MLNVLDISNWQSDIDVDALSGVDAIICKATEDTYYVDPYCDGFYQAAKNRGLLRGFYHFAGNSDPIDEADFFIDNTEGYFNDGIPILDWEGDQSVDWVNSFVNQIHDRTGVWPIIYANPWRFNQGGVEANCGRWVASYPEVTSPSFEQAAAWDCPSVDGLVVGWQFCSDGHVSGYDGNLDCSVFYIDAEGWAKYANASESAPNPSETKPEWISQNGSWWYRHADGSYTTDDWEQIDGAWYHFDSEGWMQTGWISVNDKWYYLDPVNGDMKAGWISVDDKQYYLDPVDGDMKTGWISVDGNRYWLSSDGSMVKNQISEINGKFYAFDEDGKLTEGDLNLTTSDDGSIKAEKA